MSTENEQGQTGPSRGAWLALAAAILGWLFDGAEMGVFSLVGRPAIKELLDSNDDKIVGFYFSVITAAFLVGAATGGVLFGWLGDRIGRVRAMTLSVLTYAIFTGACGLMGSVTQLAIFRFIAALGMGGEWSLGVALVMEVWPNRSRAFMAGLIGAAANVGYLMVGFVGLVLLEFLKNIHGGLLTLGLSEDLAHRLANPTYFGWRIMMLLGTLPAILTFFIRVFVPESEKWKKQAEVKAASLWATQDLLGVLAGALGPALIVYLWIYDFSAGLRLAGTLVGLAIAVAGYTYPIVRFFQRQAAVTPGESWGGTFGRMMLGAVLSGVALIGTWGSTQMAPSWADKITDAKYKAEKEQLIAAGQTEQAENLYRPRAKEYTLIWLSVGAIVGTMAAAITGDWLGRRVTYFLLCLFSLGSAWLLFLANSEYNTMFLFTAFVAGVFTASFYGWLPLYLPELFKTQVRATGQGFCFNFGRILAAIGAVQVGNLLKVFADDVTIGPIKVAGGYPFACSAICLVYLIGMLVIWLAPETHGKPLPD